MTISIETGGGMIMGLIFKSSVIENISIDIQKAIQVIDVINQKVIESHLIAVRQVPRSEMSVSPPTITREQAKDTETLPLVTAICPKCGRTNTGTTALYHCQHCGQNLRRNN